jgi:hypothetical protein
MGGRFLSDRLCRSGHTPVSSTPTTTSEPRAEARELRGPSGVQRAHAVLERGEHDRVAPQLLGA